MRSVDNRVHGTAAEAVATQPAEAEASETQQAGATEHVEAETGTAKHLVKQQSPKSKLYSLMGRLMGREIRKDDFQYTPLGDGTTAKDGSAVKEVALKLPVGWKDGILFQGSGATQQEAEDTASAAALRVLGKFKNIGLTKLGNKTNTKPLAEYLNRLSTKNEVIRFDVSAADDQIGGLLYVLAYMGNDKNIKSDFSAELKYKNKGKNQKTGKKGVYVVRIRKDSKRLKGLKERASQVEAHTEPASLVASIMKNLGSGGSMKLRLRGQQAAAKAAVALSAVEPFDERQDLSFTSRFFVNKTSKQFGIEVSVASS